MIAGFGGENEFSTFFWQIFPKFLTRVRACTTSTRVRICYFTAISRPRAGEDAPYYCPPLLSEPIHVVYVHFLGS